MTSLSEVVAAATLLVGAIASGTPALAQEESLGPPTDPWAAQISPREVTLVGGAAAGATEYRLTSKDFKRSVGQARRYVIPLGLRESDTLLRLLHLPQSRCSGQRRDRSACGAQLPHIDHTHLVTDRGATKYTIKESRDNEGFRPLLP